MTDDDLKAAFISLVKADDELSIATTEAKELKAMADKIKSEAEKVKELAEKVVVDIMRKDGLVEEIIPGMMTNYKLGFSTPRQSVKVYDVSAVPDEFLKKEPKLKEIGEYLDKNPLTNWAGFELGESKLTWKAVKK